MEDNLLGLLFLFTLISQSATPITINKAVNIALSENLTIKLSEKKIIEKLNQQLHNGKL